MTGLLALMTTSGLAMLAIVLVAAFTAPRIRRSRQRQDVTPEMRQAAQDIQNQIDRGRDGLLR